jgi:hypothetical protein
MVPYHLMTGDVSQANYSSLRAAMNGSYSMVDDWQQNEVLPMLCLPAVQRRMQVSALRAQRPALPAGQMEIRAAGSPDGRPDQGSDGRNHGDSRRAEADQPGLAERGSTPRSTCARSPT